MELKFLWCTFSWTSDWWQTVNLECDWPIYRVSHLFRNQQYIGKSPSLMLATVTRNCVAYGDYIPPSMLYVCTYNTPTHTTDTVFYRSMFSSNHITFWREVINFSQLRRRNYNMTFILHIEVGVGPIYCWFLNKWDTLYYKHNGTTQPFHCCMHLP